jgi:hypothetical protein
MLLKPDTGRNVRHYNLLVIGGAVSIMAAKIKTDFLFENYGNDTVFFPF